MLLLLLCVTTTTCIMIFSSSLFTTVTSFFIYEYPNIINTSRFITSKHCYNYEENYVKSPHIAVQSRCTTIHKNKAKDWKSSPLFLSKKLNNKPNNNDNNNNNDNKKSNDQNDDATTTSTDTIRVRIWKALASGEELSLKELGSIVGERKLGDLKDHLSHVEKQAKTLKNKSNEWRERRGLITVYGRNNRKVEKLRLIIRRGKKNIVYVRLG